MYVAAKGGERAIENAHRLLARERRGDLSVPELSLAQIREQLTLAVDRVMNEGSLYDRELAALAIKQARGDLIEAIFLLREFRATLPRFGASEPIDTSVMTLRRRVSAAFKDLPGGQVLGSTFDYSHRLLEFPTEGANRHAVASAEAEPDPAPRVTDLLTSDDLIEKSSHYDAQDRVGDLTQDPLSFPANRDVRLQNLVRGDEGFLLALGYSTQRGYGRTHPFVGEIRLGEVQVEFAAEEVGFAVPLGSITVTECQMVNQFRGSATEPPRFTRGYGLGFGHCERKVMAMALVDRALRAPELGEEVKSPAQDEEFVLSHSDNVQATGFVEHLKLPHYVDFQSELGLVRRLRADFVEAKSPSRAAHEAPESAPPAGMHSRDRSCDRGANRFESSGRSGRSSRSRRNPARQARRSHSRSRWQRPDGANRMARREACSMSTPMRAVRHGAEAIGLGHLFPVVSQAALARTC